MESGTKLNHYEILSLLGKGGMGEVWRARDTKLDREVAIKTLPEEFAEDADRLARFEREAKLLASLNHPNIAAIHGFEEDNGTHFLVLELVEGDTLADRLKRGAVPAEESLKLALQIAEALEAAHEKSVVHRDLKPANVKVTPDAKIKVLDFGLAKAFAGDEADVGVSNSPTLSMAATQQGVILGTAAYMSPEQASGVAADHRADVWAFGVVLFEILTGGQVFTGKTASHVMGAVLNIEPDWNNLPINLHPTVRRLLERSLEKEPKDRLAGISDARFDLQKVLADPSGVLVQPVAEGVQAVSHSRLPWVAAVVLAVATGLTVWSLVRPTPPPVTRFDVTPEELTITIFPLFGTSVAVSPDGRSIAYLTGGSQSQGGERLDLRSLDQLGSTTLVSGGRLVSPFFSADGDQVGFYDNQPGAPLLRRVSLCGGPTSTITPLRAAMRGASWGADDTIVFATVESRSGLWRVATAGGEPEQLTTPDVDAGEVNHWWPEILPGGDAVLFIIVRNNGQQIAVLNLDTRDYRVLLEGGTFPQYSPTGHLLYGVDGNLWAVGFDLGQLDTVGDPVPVQEGVLTKTGPNAMVTEFGLSDNGNLIYVPGAGTANLRTLLWVDREGNEELIAAEPRIYFYPRLSPDGRRVALDARDEEDDILVWDLETETLTRLTFNDASEVYPVWTTLGERIAYRRDDNIYWKASNNTGTATLMAENPDPEARGGIPHFFSPDGTQLVFQQARPETGGDIGMMAVDGSTEPEWLFASLTFAVGPPSRRIFTVSKA